MLQQTQTSVYIYHLPINVDEAWLKDFLSEIATPIDIKIFQQVSTKNAVAKFATHEEAVRIILELNYTKLNNIPIVIAWPPETRDKRACLLIKNLDPSIEAAQLHDAFSNFGEVHSCEIPLIDGRSSGYGYVRFMRFEDAEAAQRDLKGAYIENRLVQIEFYRPVHHVNPEQVFTNVCIKNLPDSFRTDEDVKRLFEPYGEVQSSKLSVDYATGKLRHFGFCNMVNHDDAVRAVQELNGKILEGSIQPLIVTRFMSKVERANEIRRKTAMERRKKYVEAKDRIFVVKGFPDTISSIELEQIFSQYGEIESFKITESFNYSRLAYVCFKEREMAANFLKESLKITVHDKHISVSYFKPAEYRTVENYSDLSTRAKSQLICAIKEKCFDDDEANIYINASKKLSNDQISVLNSNQMAFQDWFDMVKRMCF